MDRLPAWFKRRISDAGLIKSRLEQFRHLSLNTVCESAHCPNIVDCFNKGTATFMILGNICSRNCRFCAVDKGNPKEIDINEQKNVAAGVAELKLFHVVITSVTRDDLLDGGAGQFALTIKEIRKQNSDTKIEVLIPDFGGKLDSVDVVIEAEPDIIAHNLETVERLYKNVRSQANYKKSLRLLKRIKDIDTSIYTKSGLILGLGETRAEVLQVMDDLLAISCDIVTLGQYLAPSQEHVQVERYIPPEEFEELKEIALSLGFKSVSSGPWVRSSYYAEEVFKECLN